MMRRTSVVWALLLATVVLTSACKKDTGESTATSGGSTAATDPTVGASYLLGTEPAAAIGVLEMREKSVHDEDVVVVGRIGGSEHPWVDGRAAFSIVDESLAPCSEGCPTPWDYCCADGLPDATVLVKFVDRAGKVVAGDARRLWNVAELATVVVKGKTSRDDAGNVTILADGMYVRR